MTSVLCCTHSVCAPGCDSSFVFSFKTDSVIVFRKLAADFYLWNLMCQKCHTGPNWIMDALCTDRPVSRFWNSWIWSTIRAYISHWVPSVQLLLKVCREAHELSLTTHRVKLSLNYVLKLKSLLENPAYSCVFEPENTKLFGIHILPHLEKSKLNLNLVDDAPSLDIIPWKIPVPAVQFDLASFKKDTTNPEIHKQLCLQLISEYPLSEKNLHQRF